MVFVVVTDAVVLEVFTPWPAAVTSSGLARSRPLYSTIRMSANAAAPENATLTVFDAAPTTFFA